MGKMFSTSITFLTVVYLVVAGKISKHEYGYDYLDEEYYGYDDIAVDEEFTPEFLTSPSNLKVSLGGTARLVCEVKDLGPNTISWRKVDGNESSESVFVAVGPTLLTTDPRFQVNLSDHGSTLQIILVQEKDEGDYQCQVFSHPPVYLTHSLNIKRPPNVTILGRPESGTLTLLEGEELALICQGAGDPEPRMFWHRKNQRLADGNRQIEGDQLIFTRVSRKHAGEYVCTADNGFGAPAESSIIVQVQYGPVVSLEANYIHHLHENTQLELICYALGQPTPLIHWDGLTGVPRANNMHFNIRKGKEILLINDISTVVNRTISCSGSNSLGKAMDNFITKAS